MIELLSMSLRNLYTERESLVRLLFVYNTLCSSFFYGQVHLSLRTRVTCAGPFAFNKIIFLPIS